MSATLLVGGTVVELDPVRVEARDLVLIGDRVGDLNDDFPTTSTVDCSGCVVMPGFVVGHTHLYSGLAAGMPAAGPAPKTFLEILERVWWRLDQALDEASLRASVQVAAIAAIRSGATAVVDHHESPRFVGGSLDVIAEELDALGLRALLAYGATDRHGAEGASAGLDESERFARAHASDRMIRGAIGLHAPFTCSDDTLAGAAERAVHTNAWLHYHAAEGPDDQVAARERWGERLFHRLDALGLVGERTIVAHGVDMDPAEAQLLRDRRTWLLHQARSNMNNGVGYAGRLRELERVALGTDGIDGDMLAELSAAFFRGRESTGPAVWRDPVPMLANGHRMMGEVFGEPLYGRIVKGAPADVLVLDYRAGTPLSAETLGGHLLFGMSSRYVRDVYVAGRAVLRNRKLIGVDERAVMAKAQEAAKALWARMESI